MNPWPGAFPEISGESVKVWEAVAMQGTEKAGYIAGIRPEKGVLVGTGKGLLLLRQVQAPGRKRVSAAQFARGRRLRQGEVFNSSKSGVH